MRDLDEIQLDKRADPVEEPPPGTRGRWAVLIVLSLLAGGALFWYFYRSSDRAASGVRVETESAVARGEERPTAVEGEDIPLPPLGETDALVRRLVGLLSSHPTITAWLTTDQLVRNFTVVVINIADGQTPARHLSAVRPAGSFSVEDGEVLVVHPRSFRRYDTHADAVASLDAEGAARLYATLRPRIQDAAAELGHPGDFDAVLERAMAELLKTPVIEEPIELAPKSVSYDFADPRLQNLSAAQRQFLRMGPRNVRITQAKLRDIGRHLGFQQSDH